MVATRAREKMCAVNVSVEAVIASGPETLRSSQVGDAWRPWDVFPPPWDGCATPIQAFSIFSLQRISPRYARRSPRGPKKAARPSTHFPPPIFRGADTRTHNRIRAGRSDAGICLPARDRGSESDIATHAPPLSPRPRRASASDRPSRSPPRSCRPTCLAKPDDAPTKVLGSSRLASRCITNY